MTGLTPRERCYPILRYRYWQLPAYLKKTVDIDPVARLESRKQRFTNKPKKSSINLDARNLIIYIHGLVEPKKIIRLNERMRLKLTFSPYVKIATLWVDPY